MTEILFEPWSQTLIGSEGETLLEVALENDIPLAHACGGDAVCSTCAVRVIQGLDCLVEMEETERETLEKLLPTRSPDTRLACQARLKKSSGSRVRAVSLEAEGLSSR